MLYHVIHLSVLFLSGIQKYYKKNSSKSETNTEKILESHMPAC